MPELPPAPEYTRQLEAIADLLLRGTTAERRLMIARRMMEVFRHVERRAASELGSDGG